MDKESKEIAAQIANQLNSIFTWNETIEGHDFWQSVRDRLRRISKGEALNPLEVREYRGAYTPK